MPRVLLSAILLAVTPVTLAAPPPSLPELHPPPTALLEGAATDQPDYALLPEGTYISERLIRIVPLGTHSSAAVFLRSSLEKPIRPMALLPCANTQAMEQIALTGDPSEDIRFEVSGQVFTSGGLNYFLPLIFRVISPDEIIPSPDDIPGAPVAVPEAAPPLLAESADDVSVAELIKELETASASPANNPNADGQRPITLKREGGVISLRRGRIEPGSSGAWTFVFDSGAAAPDPSVDSPMGLMPSSLVMT